jgi:uncharacterized protein YqeY
MREQLAEALKAAMKAQDKRRTATLRLVSAAIKDRDLAAQGEGRERIDDAEIVEVLARMVKQRRESTAIYEGAGRIELAEQEREEIEIIEEFLPARLDAAEVRAAVEAAIEEAGAASLKDMGRVMAILKQRFAGRIDFAEASRILKEELA